MLRMPSSDTSSSAARALAIVATLGVAPAQTGPTVASGFDLESISLDVAQPTAVLVESSTTLLVTSFGAEGPGTGPGPHYARDGEVVRIDLVSGASHVVAADFYNPIDVLVHNGTLYVLDLGDYTATNSYRGALHALPMPTLGSTGTAGAPIATGFSSPTGMLVPGFQTGSLLVSQVSGPTSAPGDTQVWTVGLAPPFPVTTYFAGAASPLNNIGDIVEVNGVIYATDNELSNLYGLGAPAAATPVLQQSPFQDPRRVDADPAGLIYVTDFAQRAVYHVEPTSGNYDVLVSNLQEASHVATGAGSVFVLDALASVVWWVSPDFDSDGLGDPHEAVLGTDPANPDSDGDGLLDGTEVDMQSPLHPDCPDPLAPDSDHDSLLDGEEIGLGTSPCEADTDGDTLPDAVDPAPLNPTISGSTLEQAAFALACAIERLDLAAFDGPNDNAKRGRRNALATHARQAARALGQGAQSAAVALLQVIVARTDTATLPQDWITWPIDRHAIWSAGVALIALAAPR